MRRESLEMGSSPEVLADGSSLPTAAHFGKVPLQDGEMRWHRRFPTSSVIRRFHWCLMLHLASQEKDARFRMTFFLQTSIVAEQCD